MVHGDWKVDSVTRPVQPTLFPEPDDGFKLLPLDQYDAIHLSG